MSEIVTGFGESSSISVLSGTETSEEPTKRFWEISDIYWALALTILSFAFGMAYVVIVPAGLPYDEPSHFNVLQLYSKLNGMPVVGTPGVTYEALHPPLYYSLFGLLYRALSPSFSPRTTFYLMRTANMTVTSLLVPLTYFFAREFGGRAFFARMTAVFVALNPSLLAIGSSIQNDSLLLVICGSTAYLTIRWTHSGPFTTSRSMALGTLATLALLTKTPALALLLFIGLSMMRNDLRRSGRNIAVVGAIVFVGTGWWFLRNYRLYGSFTGAKSEASLFETGRRMSLISPFDWFCEFRSWVTYYSVPVEYWRNVIRTPRWIEAVLAISLLLILFGVARSLRGWRGSFSRFLNSVTFSCLLYSFSCIGFWLSFDALIWWVPARASLLGLITTVYLLALAARKGFLGLPPILSGINRNTTIFMFALFLLTLVNMTFLHQVSSITSMPFEITF